MTSAMRTRPSLRRRTVLATAIAVIGLAGAKSAFADPDLVDLKVVDRDTGQPLRVWRHHGRLYVAGDPGRRYALRVTNHTDGRVLVVMSVDGVNILTGETAGYDQRGYVFGPYQSYDLTGWRKSNSEVAAFAFAPLPQSYAARTGRPADVGVIGLAVFKEKVVPVEADEAAPQDRLNWRDEGSRSADRAGAPAAPAPPRPGDYLGGAQRAASGASKAEAPRYAYGQPDEKLGTAHGARERSVVNIVAFERATSYPQSVQEIAYDTFDNLVAMGVIHQAYAEHRPRPFPSRRDEEGYVPDPPREP